MGYRAAKEEVEKKRRKVKRIVLCILLAVLLSLSIFSFFIPPESWRYYFAKPSVDKRKAGELRIHFLDVGQGDCTVIELPDGKVALIDGGDDKSTPKKRVMRYLNALHIDKIDHLVVTHTDKDHCGGLTEVFRYKKVVNAYLPHDFEEEDVAYAKVYALALEENCEMIKASRSLLLNGENADYRFGFLSPYAVEATGEYSDDCAVLWLEYAGIRTLFCADADEDLEKTLLKDEGLGLLPFGKETLADIQILKVAHHGSADGTSRTFLQRINAKKAIISCGKDNQYGHPKKQTLERLEGEGIEVYRTDVQGHIVATVQANGNYRVESLR